MICLQVLHGVKLKHYVNHQLLVALQIGGYQQQVNLKLYILKGFH